MTQTHENPPAVDADGLSGMQNPARNCTHEGNARTAGVQAKLDALKREFIAECLRIAALKASHGADNVEISDDLNAERDLRIATRNLREARRAFRELGGRSS